MNRRQLGLGAAVSAFTSTIGLAARAQTRDPGAVAFYDSFNDQLARLPATIQQDVRAFYELNGWRPVWTAERLRTLQAAASRAERHGLAPGDYFDFETLATSVFVLASMGELEESALPALTIVAAGLLPVILLSRTFHEPHITS